MRTQIEINPYIYEYISSTIFIVKIIIWQFAKVILRVIKAKYVGKSCTKNS